MPLSRNKNVTQRCAPKDVPQGTSGQKHVCTVVNSKNLVEYW